MTYELPMLFDDPEPSSDADELTEDEMRALCDMAWQLQLRHRRRSQNQ